MSFGLFINTQMVGKGSLAMAFAVPNTDLLHGQLEVCGRFRTEQLNAIQVI